MLVQFVVDQLVFDEFDVECEFNVQHEFDVEREFDVQYESKRVIQFQYDFEFQSRFRFKQCFRFKLCVGVESILVRLKMSKSTLYSELSPWWEGEVPTEPLGCCPLALE